MSRRYPSSDMDFGAVRTPQNSEAFLKEQEKAGYEVFRPGYNGRFKTNSGSLGSLPSNLKRDGYALVRTSVGNSYNRDDGPGRRNDQMFWVKLTPPAAPPKPAPKPKPAPQKRPPFKPDPVTKKAQTVERIERTKDLSVAGYSSADAGSNKPLQNAVNAIASDWNPKDRKINKNQLTEKDYDYLKSRGIGDREIFNEGVKRNLDFSKGMKEAWSNELAVNPDDAFSFMTFYKSGLMNSLYGDRTTK